MCTLAEPDLSQVLKSTLSHCNIMMCVAIEIGGTSHELQI